MNKINTFWNKVKVLWCKVQYCWKYAPRKVKILDISCWMLLITFLLVVL
ncbi:hypothetical protein VPHF99_0162 [Vibrio phage F99]